jgi:DNA-binding transcriptional ArsR family regulator
MDERAMPRIEFQGSLPYRLISFLALLTEAARYEGFDARLYAAHAELPSRLRRDLELLFVPFGNRIITARLCDESPELDDFTAFMAWFIQSSDGEVRSAVQGFLRDLYDGEDCSETQSSLVRREPPDGEDQDKLRAYVLESNSVWTAAARRDEAVFDQLLRLLRSPLELKARLAIILAQFWEGPEVQALEECEPTVQQSLTFHQGRTYEGFGTQVYEQVTGKSPASEATKHKLERAARIIFIPSCHTGAYAASWCPPNDEETLLVVFNARPSGGSQHSSQGIIRDLFPPLKALGDEVRLQILLLLQEGELYAQQIVDQLDVGQSSVSRHLSLLVAGRVLSVRKENGMKFYRFNRPAMERFTRLLNSVLREEGSD